MTGRGAAVGDDPRVQEGVINSWPIGQPVEVERAGVTLRYSAPTALVRENIESLLAREPTTIPWLESMTPDDVLVDVGANIGLYSVYAALISGARVYAFEPESQNYAELNKNIYLNDLHDQVTAYCLALSDRAEVSSLYLCTFSVGFGHHDFGANSWPADLHRGLVVYPKEGRLRQGALGMTLDALVESGAVPVPNHIKVDVDGFEWKVLAGASRTIMRPEVKSVLVETDFAIEESVETIRFMSERGWYFSEDQVSLLRDELLPPGLLGERIAARAGQQNFIYFRDTETYPRIFAEFVEAFTFARAEPMPDRQE